MKSKIINKKPIDWEQVIKVDDILMSPDLIQNHRNRIDTIFSQYDEKYREEQLNKVVLHDVLFSKGMDVLDGAYEIEIDPEELEALKSNTKNNYPNLNDDNLTVIARKIITKELIFADLQKEFNITVNDDELKQILLDYYQATNQPIREFMSNDEQYKVARTSILSEKTVSFIIQKFKFDLTTLAEKIKNFVKFSSIKSN